MFVEYGEHESNSVQMWDPNTEQVIVMQDVIWLKHLHFQTDIKGVLELEDETEVIIISNHKLKCRCSREAWSHGMTLSSLDPLQVF